MENPHQKNAEIGEQNKKAERFNIEAVSIGGFSGARRDRVRAPDSNANRGAVGAPNVKG